MADLDHERRQRIIDDLASGKLRVRRIGDITQYRSLYTQMIEAEYNQQRLDRAKSIADAQAKLDALIAGHEAGRLRRWWINLLAKEAILIGCALVVIAGIGMIGA